MINMQLKWLIVEDALRDQKGHWFEYISTFQRGLSKLGDEVTILADRQANSFILEHLKALPILPHSIWHRMSDGTNPLIRYLRLPIHAWQTVIAIRRFLFQGENYDVIFIPTVLVHHLLAWTWLIKTCLRKYQTQIILFFPNAPVSYDLPTDTYKWTNSPTTKLLRFLLKRLTPEVISGRVILGAETYPMKNALSLLSGVAFTYFPHPVEPLNNEKKLPSNKKLVMGSYGAARYEKGNDILYRAIAEFSSLYPNSDIEFILQCLDGFEIEKNLLLNNNKVTWLTNYFQPREYPLYLHKTDLMLLPYRISSYSLRVSRVVIEALVNGIPVIATDQTTLADQASEFGALVKCQNEDYISLAKVIHYAAEHYDDLKMLANRSMLKAQLHFSVKHFRECLLNIQIL
ncbi:MAG: glycosyltransferase [Pseudanabaenaceae cyanobacterium bins.39]|nr:glycosyltransferase [Pseudanabaenaceae cyanobacterium bins.39]